MVGANAQGKTNLLEAMHYVFSLESPRVRNDLPLVRDGANAAFLRGEVQSAAGRYLVEVEIRASGQNRVHLNRSPVRRKRDLRRWVRSVFAGPDDLEVVQGEPDARRRFMDEAVRALWPSREGVGPAYERALRQRNRLLKEWDGAGLPAGLQGWDAELIARGVALTAARKEAVDRLSPAAGEEFRSLSGDPLMVAYRPSVQSEPLAEAFGIALAQRRADELARRTTLIGPHRDELEVAIRSFTVRGFASHGEAWGAALCLRLALAEALAAEVGGEAARSNADLAERADVVVLCHKPAQLAEVAAEVAGRAGAVVSILGGTPLAAVERAYPGVPVYRFMPNIAAEAGRGVLCYAPGAHAADGPEREVLELFGRLGTVIALDEPLIEPATALMGCGPAFFALVVEALVDAGVRHGLPAELGGRMAVETMAGSAAVLSERGLDTLALRRRVTSPGGSTARGLTALERGGVRAALSDAVDAVVEVGRR